MTSPPVRHLPPVQERPANNRPRPGLRMGMVAGVIAAALISLWSGASGTSQPNAEPTPLPAVRLAEPDPASAPSPAVTSFRRFVAAVDRGDTARTIELLRSEVPDVIGLGTASYPYVASDPGLWESGSLDTEKVIGLVEYLAALPGSVALSDCAAFADGPRVVIVSCDYSADGRVITPLGPAVQEGKIYGFMVDEAVAGMAHIGGFDRPAWNQLLRFAEQSGHAELAADAEWTYSAETAQLIMALAEEMAAAPIPR